MPWFEIEAMHLGRSTRVYLIDGYRVSMREFAYIAGRQLGMDEVWAISQGDSFCRIAANGDTTSTDSWGLDWRMKVLVHEKPSWYRSTDESAPATTDFRSQPDWEPACDEELESKEFESESEKDFESLSDSDFEAELFPPNQSSPSPPPSSTTGSLSPCGVERNESRTDVFERDDDSTTPRNRRVIITEKNCHGKLVIRTQNVSVEITARLLKATNLTIARVNRRLNTFELEENDDFVAERIELYAKAHGIASFRYDHWQSDSAFGESTSKETSAGASETGEKGFYTQVHVFLTILIVFLSILLCFILL